jgi:hypothetical protein
MPDNGQPSDETTELKAVIEDLVKAIGKPGGVGADVTNSTNPTTLLDAIKVLNTTLTANATNSKNTTDTATSTTTSNAESQKKLDDIKLQIEQLELEKRKEQFKEYRGPDEKERTSEEKLKSARDVGEQTVKKAEDLVGGFVDRFIPGPIKDILGLLGGNQLLENINRVVINNAKELSAEAFAREELKEEQEIKRKEKELKEKSRELTLNKLNQKLEGKGVSNETSVVTEPVLTSTGEDVKAALAGKANTTEEETSSGQEVETSSGQEVETKGSEYRSEEERKYQVEIIGISDDAAGKIADKLRETLSERRELGAAPDSSVGNTAARSPLEGIQEGEKPAEIEGVLQGGIPAFTTKNITETITKSPSWLSVLGKAAVGAAGGPIIKSIGQRLIKAIPAIGKFLLAEGAGVATAASIPATGGADAPVAVALEIAEQTAAAKAADEVIKILSGASSFEANFSPKAEAAGGPVEKGSPYLVGEKGPELFVPNSSGNIIPNQNVERDITSNSAIEKLTEAIAKITSSPSEGLAAISKTTDTADESKKILQTINQTLLDIGNKLEAKNTEVTGNPKGMTGVVGANNSSSNNTINIISQGNPITNSRLRIDNFLYNRRANA